MIRYKQKNYFLAAVAPAVGTLANGVMAVGTVGGLIQGSEQQKQSEEQQEEMLADNAKTRKALNNLANSGATDEQKQQAAGLFSDHQRLYAATPPPPAATGGFVNNAKGFGKDLLALNKGALKNVAKIGAAFGAAGYIGNRIIKGFKNHEEGNDEETKDYLSKAALAVGTTGLGVLAARKGALGKSAQTFMTSGYGGKALHYANKISPIGRDAAGKWGLQNKGDYAFGIGIPLAMYGFQKFQEKRQAENTQEESSQGYQQQYSEYSIPRQKEFGFIGETIASTKGFFKKIPDYWRYAKAHPGNATTGAVNRVGTFMGFMGNKGGTAGTQAAFQHLLDQGKKSGNVWSQKVGEWGLKHKNLANLGLGAAAAGVGMGAMGLAESAITTPLKVVDRDAFDEEQNV